MQRRRQHKPLTDTGNHGFSAIPGRTQRGAFPFRVRYDARLLTRHAKVIGLTETKFAGSGRQFSDTGPPCGFVKIDIAGFFYGLVQYNAAMAALFPATQVDILVGKTTRAPDFAFRCDNAGFKPGKRCYHLERGTGGVLTAQGLVGHGMIGRRTQRFPGVLGNTVDYFVQIEGRGRRHDHNLARLHFERNNSGPAQRFDALHGLALQQLVDGQHYFPAGLTWFALQLTHGSPAHIHLVFSVARDAAQPRFKTALNTKFANFLTRQTQYRGCQ